MLVATAAPIRINANSPPGPSTIATSPAALFARPIRSAMGNNVIALTATNPAATRSRIGDDLREVETGTHRDEEQPEQESLEWLNSHFDLSAILGLGQQQACNERSQSHGLSAESRNEAGADDNQQTCGDEQLVASCRRHHLKERPKNKAPEPRQTHQGNDGRSQCVQQT